MNSKESLEYIKLKKTLSVVNIKELGDGGKRMLDRIAELEKIRSQQFLGLQDDLENSEEGSDGDDDDDEGSEEESESNDDRDNDSEGVESESIDDNDDGGGENESDDDNEESKVEDKKSNTRNKNVSSNVGVITDDEEKEEDKSNSNTISISSNDDESLSFKKLNDRHVKQISSSDEDKNNKLKLNQLKSSESEINSKLNSLGLNDTNSSIIDDSIIELNDSDTNPVKNELTKQLDKLTNLQTVVQDTPESPKSGDSFPIKLNSKKYMNSTRINESYVDSKLKPEDYGDDDEIIEISPKKEFKPFSNSPALKRYEQEHRPVPSWSPNFEKLKSKIEKNTHDVKRIQLIDEPAIVKHEPKKGAEYNFDHFGDNLASSASRFRNRNIEFEDRLKELSETMLHVLETKPTLENFKPKWPKALNVKLLDHQFYALAWLKWREATTPRGGILADDMGLGKTLTILSYLRLIKEEREEQEEDEEDDKRRRQDEDDDDDDEIIRKPKKKSSNRKSSKRLRTLIIVPASLLHQWQNEIANRFEKNSLKFHVYHEANRKKLAYNLEDNDIVFTTYEIVTRELEALGDAKDIYEIKELLRRSNSPLASIKWKRIVLDEAHRIKNHTTKANKIICSLQSKYRLVLTGTPVQNSLTDFFSLIKFLHLEPLNDIKVWKYLFGNEKAESVTKPKSATAIKNAEKRDNVYNTWLLILSDTLILRRTKADKVSINGELRSLVALPEKNIDIIRVRLNKTEKFIYDKLFKESAEKVRKFLIQQQKRLIGVSMGGNFSEILVYLLRLRQACSHISLLSECLDLNELQKLKSETEEVETMMGNLNLDNTNKSDLNDLCSGVNDLDTCVDKNYQSAKLYKLLEMVDDITTNHDEDKIIIVSQWTSLLNIIGHHLKERNLEFYEIKGDVNLHKRNELVECFNKPYETDVKIMLLSLNAGGVGLNLIGANRMFLLDIHWNPALEQQASDRIYRVGQKKNVNIYRFICEETIEERIQALQEFKIDIASRVCNAHNGGAVGVKNTKLTAKDIKLLFQAFDNPQPSTSQATMSK